MPAEEFTFQYMVARNTATLEGDTLTIKMGIRRQAVSLRSLRHLYVKHNQSAGIRELILNYETDGGKKKNMRAYSNEDEPQFSTLVDRLVELRPEIDIRNLDEKLAFEKIGAVDSERLAFIFTPILIVIIIAVFMIPFYLHGFDGGHEVVSLARLATGYKPDSRNLTVNGVRALGRYMEERTTHKGRTTVRLYIALVPDNVSRLDNIPLILETPELSATEVNRIINQNSFKGILRDVWWEGVSGNVRDFFTDKLNYPLADNVMLLEYEADPSFDMMIANIVLGTTIGIMLIIGIVMWIIRFRKSKG